MRAPLAFYIVVLLMGGVGCDVTTEITKAPFELTSAIVKPTFEFTSSTTPGTTAFNGHARARQQLEIFAAYSYDDVRSDIARGGGEYLISLATLAGVAAASQETFRVDMQSNYAAIYEPGLSQKETWARVVNTAWSAGHGHDTGGQ